MYTVLFFLTRKPIVQWGLASHGHRLISFPNPNRQALHYADISMRQNFWPNIQIQIGFHAGSGWHAERLTENANLRIAVGDSVISRTWHISVLHATFYSQSYYILLQLNLETGVRQY